MKIQEFVKCYKIVSGDFVFLVSFMVLNLRRRGAFPILALGPIKDFAEGAPLEYLFLQLQYLSILAAWRNESVKRSARMLLLCIHVI